MTRDPRDDGAGDDLPEWPDDVVVPDDISELFGQAQPSPAPPASLEPGGAKGAVPGDARTIERLEGAAPGDAELRPDDGVLPMTAPGDADAPAASVPVSSRAAASEAATDAEPIVRTTAVVLTGVRQAKVLAGLMALQGIEAAVVPSGRGAIAVRYVEQLESEVDPAEALSGIPREAEALGAALSMATRSEVVLLAAHVNDVDGEIAGQVVARRYRGGQIVEDPPPGLVLAQADAVAERLLIGLIQAPQVPGYISSAQVTSPRQPGRSFFGRRRRGADDRPTDDGTGDRPTGHGDER